MKKGKAENYIVVSLFVFVLVLFSVADRDSKKLKRLYTYKTDSTQKLTGLIDHATGKE